jgi:hypothetical protein
MKGAIASVEIFAFAGEDAPRRLSLTIAAPARSRKGDGWECRVVLADRFRPETVSGPDSFCALQAAFDLARAWVSELRAQGLTLTRDRAGEMSFDFG